MHSPGRWERVGTLRSRSLSGPWEEPADVSRGAPSQPSWGAPVSRVSAWFKALFRHRQKLRGEGAESQACATVSSTSGTCMCAGKSVAAASGTDPRLLAASAGERWLLTEHPRDCTRLPEGARTGFLGYEAKSTGEEKNRPIGTPQNF